MKHRLYPKLLLSYLLYGIVAILFLTTLVQRLTNSYIEKTESQSLYREAIVLSNNYAVNYFNNSYSIYGIQNELETIGAFLSSEIWITDTQGRILINSADPSIGASILHEGPDAVPRIEGFDITDFGNQFYTIGDFYDHFSDDYMTVYAPITVEYETLGYVIIHKPLSVILKYSNGFMNISSATAGIVFLCSFIVLIFFTTLVYMPIRKITKAATGYAKGEFDQEIPVHTNDEVGYLAKTLNYMSSELAMLEEDQRKFVSNVSHDFRSPLTSIKGYVEAILDGTIPHEMQDKYLNIILFETERLNKLTQSLLDLNRFGHHGIMLDIADFDINRMIKTTIRTFEGTCNKKGITFDLVLTGRELLVRGDMTKIQQVLYNLIDNAIKFSHHDSSIKIETDIKNEKVFISVKDSGIGIPADSIKKIWDRFYKTDLSRGKDKKGTGLGLSIVKEIMQAHNENINVISTEGVGTEFIFTLPLSAKEAEND